MATLEAIPTTIRRPEPETPFDEAHLAAVAFLARYSGRTLDAYRHDLRAFFQWANDNGLTVLHATRPHVELYRAAMEERRLAASTIDRRMSTVCGFYRFAHIDGRIGSNPAQYVRRPKVHPSEGRGMDRAELGTFLFTAERFDRDHTALAVLLGLNGLRVSEACATNIEDLGLQRGHRTLRILGKGNKLATIPLVPRTARTIDLAVGERHEGPILRRRDGQRLDRRTAHRWVRSIGADQRGRRGRPLAERAGEELGPVRVLGHLGDGGADGQLEWRPVDHDHGAAAVERLGVAVGRPRRLLRERRRAAGDLPEGLRVELTPAASPPHFGQPETGRASCRERV